MKNKKYYQKKPSISITIRVRKNPQKKSVTASIYNTSFEKVVKTISKSFKIKFRRRN